MKKEKAAAISAAKEAGRIMLEYLHKERKPEYKRPHEIVTEADIMCERKIRQLLCEEFPEYGFLGEEEGCSQESDLLWVVDPIDGTNNFAAGYPWFCTAIALAKGGQPLLGVVYNPLLDELFYAEKKGGTSLNGCRAEVSKRAQLADAVVGAALSYGTAFLGANLNNMKRLKENMLGIRISGAAAYEISLVASGRLDAFFCYSLQPWDIAAAKLIAEEAGAKVTDFKGRKCDIFSQGFVVSNGLIHGELLKKLEVPE